MTKFLSLRLQPYTKLILISLFLFYWLVSIRHLTIIPRVYEDEPWQASTGWKLATEGIFGSDMFTGLYHMEQRYYGYMPVHLLLLAGIFRLAGLGLFQSRFEPVVMGLLTLTLTFALGQRLYGKVVGLWGIVFLLFVRLTGLTPSQLSGILFLDIPRIARYDMVVPVFGLSAVHLYLWARQHGTGWYGAAGFFAGLAGLSHLYGVFWLVVLGILSLWDRVRWRDLTALSVGFLMPWLPYIAYVLTDLPDWRGQMRNYTPRFQLLDIHWYLDNVWRERHRYDPGLEPGWKLLTRPGLWGTAVLLPVSLLFLIRRAISYADKQARVLLTSAVVLPALFALLIYLKLANYLVTVMPVFAVVTAWGGVQIWKWVGRKKNGRILRILFSLVIMAVLVEGILRITVLETAATTTTPYQTFITQVKQHIPPGSRVLGLHHYWFGLEEFDYRSWTVPLLKQDSHYWQPPLTIEQALIEVNPDVILWDERMRIWAEGTPETAERIKTWMVEQRFVQMATVQDPTYGDIEIFIIKR